MTGAVVAMSVEQRARQSLGISDEAIYGAVQRVLRERDVDGGRLLDVGCGEGHLHRFVASVVDEYVGTDIVRYEGFPADARFLTTNLDTGRIPVDDGEMDVVCAVEVIEHLESPRSFFRELTRCVRPGGLLIVTTPNQLSALSLATLLLRGRHAAFQDVHYPAHLTALLEVDLLRMASEAGLVDASTGFTHCGRIVMTARHFPEPLARRFPRLLSDNIVLSARRPSESERAEAPLSADPRSSS